MKTNDINSIKIHKKLNEPESNNTDENKQEDVKYDNLSDIVNDDTEEEIDEENTETVKFTRSSKYKRRRRQIPRVTPSSPPYDCKICTETFETKDELRSHRKMSKHTEARNHACSICSKTFTSSKLRQHMRAHTKEKPYQCKICSQGFSMSGNLKRHMMTHTGERPHVCEVCGKGNTQFEC